MITKKNLNGQDFLTKISQMSLHKTGRSEDPIRLTLTPTDLYIEGYIEGNLKCLVEI